MNNRLKNILLISFLFSSCTIVKNYQQNKPFVFKNNIEIKGGDFSGDERNSLKQRMYSQLNDSMKTVVNDIFFVLHKIKNPPAYDSAYAAISARNMRSTLLHIGYYQAKDSFKADTADHTAFVFRHWLPRFEKQKRVTVKYTIQAGNPTLIDTFSYKFRIPELQDLALKTKEKSFIREDKAITKENVLGEINRLVELYRNNGYYKFTADELRMRGDTTIEVLTNADDPFETLRLLAEANEKRNKPTIKLALVLNPQSDSSKLRKYYINKVYIYPDYNGDDTTGNNQYKEDTLYSRQDTLHNHPYTLRYHSRIVKNRFLLSHLLLKKGDLYSQEDYNKTANNFARTGVWQNVNMLMVERKDSVGKIDMFIQLAPSKKYGFEGKIEASYSTNSNTNNVTVANAGNLLGLSGNVSLQSRNVRREGIKMTHSFRTGVELNLNARPNAENFINSSDIGYNLTVAVPKLVIPNNLRDYLNKDKRLDKLYSKQSILSFGVSNTNRIGLFKLNSLGFAAGYEWSPRPNTTWSLKIVNVEFSDLYNRSAAFDSTIADNPFLRYSFNTALVMGSTLGYSWVSYNPRHPNRVFSLKANLEESGWFLGILPLKDFGSINKDLRNFVKGDIEATYTIKKIKSEYAYRGFLGIGIPIGSGDSTLPFFKQYFGGGPNSMRAWPIRGIGPGSKSLPAYKGAGQRLSDRTGDIRFEMNAEYRKDLFQLIPNTLTLKWALFADLGNVWNFKNTQPDGSFDSTQFSLKNFYHDLGMNVGTGFRLDFNYVTLRFDFGFRIKRPELSENGGWKLPSIGFDDLWGKLFQKGPNEAYRKWRYENFNFTIGLNYPF